MIFILLLLAALSNVLPSSSNIYEGAEVNLLSQQHCGKDEIIKNQFETNGGTSEDEFYDGCNVKKSCFGEPEGCTLSKNCKAATSARLVDGTFEFELIASSEAAWIGVGLSDDIEMGDDSVIECVRNDTNVMAYLSYTQGKRVTRNDKQDAIKLLKHSLSDGTFYCKIFRENVTTIDGRVYDLVNDIYYLLIAAGTTIDRRHNLAHLSASEKKSLTDTSETNEGTSNDVFYDECNVNKACFGDPDGCILSKNCKAATSARLIDETYEFELIASSNVAWIGVGLSDDMKMGDDSIIECVKNNTNVMAYLSYTQGKRVTRNDKQDAIKLLKHSISDGAFYCKISRETVTVIDGRVYDLDSDIYYLLVAAGTIIHVDSIGRHNVAHLAAGEKKSLSDTSAIKAASKLLLRLHGAFMLTAWIGTASIGMLLARYFRQTWVGNTLRGNAIWFAWHRIFMVLTWLLTSIGFIFIFVELKAWSSEDNPHAILGMVTTILCFIQPLAAVVRPHPGTPLRPIFNWMHRIGGNVAHIIAIVTIFFAVKLTKAELPKWVNWILTAFVIFHIIMHITLSIMGYLTEKSIQNEDISRSDLVNKDAQKDAPFSFIRKLLLAMYLIVVISIVVALISITVAAPL